MAMTTFDCWELTPDGRRIITRSHVVVQIPGVTTAKQAAEYAVVQIEDQEDAEVFKRKRRIEVVERETQKVDYFTVRCYLPQQTYEAKER